MVDKRFRRDREHDPVAELARLIGQADRHARRAPVESGFREEITSDGDDESTGLPPAPQLPSHLDAREQGCWLDEHEIDGTAYQPCVTDQDYQNEVPSKRLRSLTLAMAITGLALVGSAGAFGYRTIFGGSVLPPPPLTTNASNEPNAIGLASSNSQNKNSRTESRAGAATTGSIGNMGSHEQQLVTVEQSKPASDVISTIPIEKRQGSPLGVGAPATTTLPAAGQAVPNQTMSREALAADPTLAASSQRIGRSGARDVTAAPDRAHLVAAPDALANANDAAAATPPAQGSGYAVQVTSERSEGRAQAAFRALQAKYPNQLSGQQPIIRRADLGAAGIYYRALVGPFASAEKAAKMCSELKAAGGDCVRSRR